MADQLSKMAATIIGSNIMPFAGRHFNTAGRVEYVA